MEFDIVLILVSLLFSAFFSGMEIAFVSSNKLRFELDKKQSSLTSRIIAIFYRHPQQYISTMLVGNNICLVMFSILMARLLGPYLEPYLLNSAMLLSLAQSVIATIIVLFAGEFLPKTIFRANPNLWLRVFSPLLLLFYTMLYPVAVFSTWLSIGIMRIFGKKLDKTANEMSFSRVDLNYLIQESIDPQEGDDDLEPEVKIFQNALDFNKVKLRDCYVPRTEIVAMPNDVDIDTLKNTFTETGFSKIVIYKGDIDNIVGYIHASEMFEHQADWTAHINPIPIVPENMAAQKLMKLFMQQKKSMAVVVDEFGGTAGIITLEDIMEEIFGDIQDEHDTEEFSAKKISDHEYVLSGRMAVDECNEKFELGLPESDEYETIAGLLLQTCGHFPKMNEKVQIGEFTFQCVKSTDSRIEVVKLYR